METAQSNKRRAEYEEETSKIRLEIELESAQCHKRAAENEEEASKIRLEKAKLDLETLKFKLGLKNLGF
ncbi:jg27217 [Pararge aegeria aegeria]|uniref:Jg27217 protein n=1 Tax=Pararge aegeria aegeria TaxID=348720 RepID=A0A8S4QX39_9NEOP|nr:jg27217 [Pararge aegeria aegeria]